ncbi:transposase [Liquorilactobacillus sicerae]|uniref:transposase n=1 Tax=Liquorilactobacillus sicerae TaxID=1416943 RepID=UPI00248017CF|nr:transposase [Liquorilactobacillus sicerae]
MDQFTKDLIKTLLSNGDVKELFRQQLETAINQILQAELTALLGYDPYDRNGFNSGNSRNGQDYRLIDSEYGKLKIAVPRDRQGQFHNHLLPAYSRRQGVLETTIIQLYSNLIKQLKFIENELLAFLSFPPAIRPTIYSTNILESLNKRIKRKTKPKEQFPNKKSLDNFIGVQVISYNKKYFNRNHRGFGQAKDTLESLFD